MIFSDVIYGKIELPDWLIPFLKIPEFARLRGVRLSNVDSYEFKDFNGPSRWEHCIGVAHLGLRCSKKMNLSKVDAVHLVLACLLHDVATPPFAHTIEYVLEGYDHELESNRILSYCHSEDSNPQFPVFASQLPKFQEQCDKTSKQLNIKVDPGAIAELVIGRGDLGFLINGSIDLDNIDNVTRASLFMGIEIDKSNPYKLCDWLIRQGGPPTDIEYEAEASVKTWLSYKNSMYSKFFNSSEEELGRQAFLQHLIRRAHKEGIPRNQIIWNTDEGLLNSIENYYEKYLNGNHFDNPKYEYSLKELVEQYRLLANVYKVIEVPIDNKEDLKLAKSPAFASWIEDELTTPNFEPFVFINSKRFQEQNVLFKREGGFIQIFKLHISDLKPKQLPEWMQQQIISKRKAAQTSVIDEVVKVKVKESLKSRPWLNLTEKRKENIKARLESVGNWGFRLSRNESLHSYPATFVHALPATLINALGLKGELIIDPFGGTGQTATEALKLGCKAISSDNNSIATMVTKLKFTYLSPKEREIIKMLTIEELNDYNQNFIPNVEGIEKWHHPETQNELSKILSFIESLKNENLKLYYKVCFSDILTSCTARKGKEHGYFADNTPLSKNEAKPPYENAIFHFLNEVKKNISIIEKFYSKIDTSEEGVKDELHNVRVLKADITTSSAGSFAIEEGTASGIITSPPYLCMADYTLGQRLSYYWLFPNQMNEDFIHEIGPRRNRAKKESAYDRYFDSMKKFAAVSSNLLRKDGFLATVIGAPIAEAYKEGNVLNRLDKTFDEVGLKLFWETKRKINWHRNHGYARLKEERIAIYVRQ